MASDGGSMYPGQQGHIPDGTWNQTWDPGMSVRDGFAMAILSDNGTYLQPHPDTPESVPRDVYDLAQRMTDEKLRRDKADRDEGKPG